MLIGRKTFFIYIYSSIQTRFWGGSEEIIFHEHKRKCMSMRCHRASLFLEQSVFLPGRPKKNNNKNLISN